MARKRYKLIAGIHVGADFSQEPEVLTDSKGRQIEKYPNKTYEQGSIVESEIDLVEKFPNKFQRLDSEKKGTFDPGFAQFPAGQVSTGLPKAATGGTPGQQGERATEPEHQPAIPPDMKNQPRGQTTTVSEQESSSGSEQILDESKKQSSSEKTVETPSRSGQPQSRATHQEPTKKHGNK